MTLQILGSNSEGNGYILKGEKESLLIECGINIKKIKAALDYNISNVAAIVTHLHGDHAKSLKAVLDAGITVYASKETFEAKGVVNHHRAKQMESGKTYMVNGFKVNPFPVHHDVPTFGFLIEHPEMGRVLFLTDTYFTDYTFPGLNNIIIECNHDTEILEANTDKRFLRERIIQSHMNIETCKKTLLANDLSKVNNIVLIHLSEKNSDSQAFKKEIKAITGSTVNIATAGLIIDFNSSPF